MLEETVARLINEQIVHELYSAYLYLDFAGYYEDEGLKGFANWYQVQAQEERDHAMLFRSYLLNNGCRPRLAAIPCPDKDYPDFSAPLEKGLEHERLVTRLIHTIYEAAYAVKDFRTMQFLDWFVKEQGEEETNADDLIKRFRLFGGDSKGLYMLDNELGTRVYTPPTLTLE